MAEMLLFVSIWFNISLHLFSPHGMKKIIHTIQKKKAIWADLQAENETPRCFSVVL